MRQVATHMYVKELLDGAYETKEGWDPNVLHCARGDVTRCNVIGTLIRQDSQYTLDDGTGQIGMRAYDEIPGLDTESGTIVQVIARPREYQGSVFLVAEIIRPTSIEWAQVRKLELGEPLQFDSSSVDLSSQEDEQPEQEQGMSNNAEVVIGIIARLDTGEGALIEDVISESKLGEKSEQIINQLLLDGEIFEIKPGVVKVL